MIAYAGFVIAVLALIGTAGLAVYYRNQYKKFQVYLQQKIAYTSNLESQLVVMGQQLEVLSKGSVGMGRRLMKVERRLCDTADRQDLLEKYRLDNTPSEQEPLFELSADRDIERPSDAQNIPKPEAHLVKLFKKRAL